MSDDDTQATAKEVGEGAGHGVCRDTIHGLKERIYRARKILTEGRPEGSAESRLASDLREVLGE
jgi:hypothetical protein